MSERMHAVWYLTRQCLAWEAYRGTPARLQRSVARVQRAAGVEYLIVGAHALAAHGFVRATRDLDVWVRPSLENAKRVMSALESFGAPMTGVVAEDFASGEIFYRIGVEPVQIDVLTSVPGLSFEAAWRAKVSSRYGGEAVYVLSRADLITAKRAAGRHQDLADVEQLEALGESPGGRDEDSNR